MVGTCVYVHFDDGGDGHGAHIAAVNLTMHHHGPLGGSPVPPQYTVHSCEVSEKDNRSVDLVLTNGGSKINTEAIREYVQRFWARPLGVSQQEWDKKSHLRITVQEFGTVEL